MIHTKGQMIFTIPVQIISVVIVIILIFGSTVFVWFLKSSTSHSYSSSLAQYDAPTYTGLVHSLQTVVLVADEDGVENKLHTSYRPFIDSVVASYVFINQYPLLLSFTDTKKLFSFDLVSKSPYTSCVAYEQSQSDSQSKKQLVVCSHKGIIHSALGAIIARNTFLQEELSDLYDGKPNEISEWSVVPYQVITGDIS
jgi:hypothetical protein